MRPDQYFSFLYHGNSIPFQNHPEKDEKVIADLNASLSALAAEARFFLKLGIGKPAVMQAARAANRNGTTIERELIASNVMQAEAFYEAFAETLGLTFLKTIDPAQLQQPRHLDSQLAFGPVVRVNRPDAPPLLVIAPEACREDSLRAAILETKDLRYILAVASPKTIRRAIWDAGSERRLIEATGQIFDTTPQFSARIVFSGFQGFATGALIAALPFLFVLFPSQTLLTIHITLSILYLLAVLQRGLALHTVKDLAPVETRDLQQTASANNLPVYTVLVALYREEKMIPQLVGALERIDWPKSLLDIKLICEADDADTLAAAQQYATGAHFEIVAVPPANPRTKPKALSYALRAARGEYLVIYDAEDRPHPGQLHEAYGRFRDGPDDLACLQAPLNISNAGASWISAIFALEYAALFRILLPLLASFRLPMPLGGTSNHFRTAILKASGGWDPFNVTEDADLGFRLHRLGYHCGVLRLPTLEDAPSKWRVWHAQRSRWFKGWLQTLMVHFRKPVTLSAEIGAVGLLALFLTSGGMLFSAIAHPLILIFVVQAGWLIAKYGYESPDPWQMGLFVIDLTNIIGSYALFSLLGRKAMSKVERKQLGKPWLKVPLYWLMLSLAAWQAAFEIRKSPFLWRKTPHEPSTAH